MPKKSLFISFYFFIISLGTGNCLQLIIFADFAFRTEGPGHKDDVIAMA